MIGSAQKLLMARAGVGGGSNPWSLSTATATGVTLDVSSDIGGNATSFFIDDGGTHLYVTYNSNVYQYTLSSAWDLSTATYDSVSFDPTANITYAFNVTFKPDGTEMYIGDFITNPTKIGRFTLSSAWDLSTASFTSVEDVGNESRGVAFSANGTKMFMSEPDVYQYSLSSAWDTTTESYDSVSLATNSGKSASGLCLTDSGTRLFVSVINFDGSGAQIEGFTLSSANDLSTATYDQTYSGSEDIRHAYFKPDGTKFFASVQSSTIREYIM